jgi:hypothetical protein
MELPPRRLRSGFVRDRGARVGGGVGRGGGGARDGGWQLSAAGPHGRANDRRNRWGWRSTRGSAAPRGSAGGERGRGGVSNRWRRGELARQPFSTRKRSARLSGKTARTAARRRWTTTAHAGRPPGAPPRRAIGDGGDGVRDDGGGADGAHAPARAPACSCAGACGGATLPTARWRCGRRDGERRRGAATGITGGRRGTQRQPCPHHRTATPTGQAWRWGSAYGGRAGQANLWEERTRAEIGLTRRRRCNTRHQQDTRVMLKRQQAAPCRV